MRKLVLMFIAMTMALSLSAKKNIVQMVSGDKDVFYKEEAVVNVVIDDHKTLIDGKDKTADIYYGDKGADEYQKFIEDLDRAHESFITFFNEKKGGRIKLTMTGEPQFDAEYTLKINVVSMNVGNAGGMVWGVNRKAGGALINGNMQLINNETDEVVCEFIFAGVKGLLSPVFKGRAISVYRYLADNLLKAVK